MTYAEWMVATSKQVRSLDIRMGQHWFNALAVVRLDIANKVRGLRGIDPFYVDDNMNRFMNFVHDAWNQEM